MLKKTLSRIMRKIILCLLVLVSGACYSQNAVQLGPTEQKLNDAICGCLTKQNFSGISTKDQAIGIFNDCILQKPQLVVNLAAERKIDLNDNKAMNTLGGEVGKNLLTQGCQAATLLFAKMSDASDGADTKIVKHTGQDSVYAVNIKRDAEVTAKSVLDSDFKTLIDHTYPPSVERAGGKEKMIEAAEYAATIIKSKGITVLKVVVGEPRDIIRIDKVLYSVVPQKVVLKSDGKTVYYTSSLLGISQNGGVSWYFVDAGNMNDEKLKADFPGISGKVTILRQSAAKELVD